jgi:hypothetical protein
MKKLGEGDQQANDETSEALQQDGIVAEGTKTLN